MQLVQKPELPLTPFPTHGSILQTLFSDCTVSTDLTALLSTSSSLLNLCRRSSWSERKLKQPLCPFPPFLVGLIPQEMEFSDQDVSSCWTESRSGPDTVGLGLDVTDVSMHYGWHSTYGTTNGQRA